VIRATHRSAVALVCRLLLLAGAFACAPAPPPNVVLVTLDTTRADHLGLYGYFRDTSPRLDAFAAEAIVVERALAPMATTLPSHTSILTARAPLEHGVLANLDHGGRRFAPAPGLRSFAEVCLYAGYRTGAFVSAAPLERGSGLETGFEIYHQPGAGFPQRRGEFTTNAALRWLDGVKGEPFFLWVHYYDAHWPFDPPSDYARLFEGGPELEAFLAARRIPDAADRSGSGLESTREVTDAYDAELRYQDAQLGRLLDSLVRRPDWDRTAVAIVGDHGEGLSQHGEAAHGGTWDEQLFVPLVLRVPGHAPERISAPVPIAESLAMLARALATPALEPFLAQATPHALGAAVMSQDAGRWRGRPGYHLALTGARFKYRRVDQGDAAFVEELYDLAEDPFELTNVAVSHPSVVRELAVDLDARLEAQARVAQELRGDAPELAPEVDPELVRRLEALGYAKDTEAPAR
jgi:arylsulfatase A-like enzyme